MRARMIRLVTVFILGVGVAAAGSGDVTWDGGEDANMLVNGDFELWPEEEEGESPIGWEVTCFPGPKVARENKIRHKGRSSVRIDLPGATHFYLGQELGKIKLGQRYVLSGYLRATQFSGEIHISITRGALAFSGKALKGTHPRSIWKVDPSQSWKRFSFEAEPENGFRASTLVIVIDGPGSVWFDTLSVRAQPRK